MCRFDTYFDVLVAELGGSQFVQFVGIILCFDTLGAGLIDGFNVIEAHARLNTLFGIDKWLVQFNIHSEKPATVYA